MDAFIFNGWRADKASGTFTFLYSLVHTDERFEFTETLTMPKSLSTDADIEKVSSVLDFLSLALGVSYWKTFCPKNIRTPHIPLTQTQAQFWNTVYTKGLGEFFYKNKIKFPGLVDFPISKKKGNTTRQSKNSSGKEKNAKTLVLLGGGKDSLVSAELLKKKATPFSLFTLGNYEVSRETANIVGAELIMITRALDPKLLELNKREGVYNGHVPISLIYSTAALLTAVLYDFSEIVISAERSANYGNVLYQGETINHQWSKSQEFETLFSEYIKTSGMPAISYHSLIRDMYEIQVAEIFSRYEQYFDVFSSCNKNFLITGKARQRWCSVCPKCVFVFAILAPFIPKTCLVSIFGKNLFADEALLPLYRELLGLEAFKPLECVGTPEETKLAFLLSYKKGDYSSDPAMKQFEVALQSEFPTIEKSKKDLLPNYEA